MGNESYEYGIVKDNPEYVIVKLTDYNKLIHQNEKINDIIKTLELIKVRLEME